MHFLIRCNNLPFHSPNRVLLRISIRIYIVVFKTSSQTISVNCPDWSNLWVFIILRSSRHDIVFVDWKIVPRTNLFLVGLVFGKNWVLKFAVTISHQALSVRLSTGKYFALFWKSICSKRIIWWQKTFHDIEISSPRFIYAWQRFYEHPASSVKKTVAIILIITLY